MKRVFVSTIAMGLLGWTAQAQQQTTPTQQQNPGQTNPSVQQPNINVQGSAQLPAVQAQPNANVQVQPNAQPNANVQVQPNAQPNVQVQPNAGVAVGTQPANAQAQGTMVQGRILRTGQDQFIVQGVDNKQYTFYTNPQTRYWMNNNPIQYSNLQVGSSVTAWYTPQGERYFVNRVNMVPAGAAVPVQENVTTEPAPAPQPVPAQPVPAQPVPAQPVPAQPAPQANATFYEGQVVRVVGQDQVVIRTMDNKEVNVYVTPQTTYRYNEQPATITQFVPGTPVRVDYDLRDRRPYARGILNRRDRR